MLYTTCIIRDMNMEILQQIIIAYTQVNIFLINSNCKLYEDISWMEKNMYFHNYQKIFIDTLLVVNHLYRFTAKQSPFTFASRIIYIVKILSNLMVLMQNKTRRSGFKLIVFSIGII